MDEFTYDPSGLPPPPMSEDGGDGARLSNQSAYSLPPPGDGSEISAPTPQKTEMEKYRAAIAALPLEQRAAMLKAQEAYGRQFKAQNAPGALNTGFNSFANMLGYGAVPYAGATIDSVANKFGYGSNKPYGDAVSAIKEREKKGQEYNPISSGIGTGLGLVGGMLTGSTEAKIGKAIAEGALYGLTQGGSGLEDLISGKGNIVAPALQAAQGALIAYPAHMIGQAISPTAVKDAAKYAYNLGVRLPAGIMNAGQKGYEHLGELAAQTASGVRQRFDDIAGDYHPAQAAQNAIVDFMDYAGQAPAKLANTFDYFSKTLSEAPDTAMDAVIKAGPQALRAMKATLKSNGADDTWNALQRGFMQRLAGPKKGFSFKDFSERLDQVPTDVRKILLEGYDDAHKLLSDVSNLGQSTMHHTGVNLIDAASQGAKVVQKGSEGFGNWVKKTVSDPLTQLLVYTHPSLLSMSLPAAVAAAPVAAAAYGARKGVQAAGKALDRRNVATSPTVSNVINNATEAARRYVTNNAGNVVSNITHYTHDPLKSFVNTVASPETAKWYSENMPAVLGGKAEGGRIAYKKGGAVKSGIEPLVQNLMARYKAVKRSQDSGTKPLLQQPDQAIVKALGVAQKAI